MYFTQIELLLIIAITITIFYILYHMANCPAYKYSRSKKIIHIATEDIPKIIHIATEDIPKINLNQKMIQSVDDMNKRPLSICDMGRPRCDIYQSNTENYSKCYNDLINYIDNGCNQNQFSKENCN